MFAGALLVVALAGIGAASRSPSIKTVCDVLANDPTALNGALITVRGEYEFSDEGTWLVGECDSHLVTRGLEWPNTISISMNPSDDNASRSWGRMVQKLRRLHADPSRDRILLTIIGKLLTRASMNDEIVQMPYGLMRAGFGHLGTAPAEIDVVSVSNIRVERAPVK
jgi:hypothetical protein